jgi:hypothetical protein
MAPGSWKDKLSGGAGGSVAVTPQVVYEHAVWWGKTFGAALVVAAVLFFVFTPHLIGDHKYRVLLWTATPYVLLTFLWPLLAAKYTRTKERAVLAVLLVVAAALCTVMVSAHFSCWCCKREGDMIEMCDMALQAAKVLEKHNINYW